MQSFALFVSLVQPILIMAVAEPLCSHTAVPGVIPWPLDCNVFQTTNIVTTRIDLPPTHIYIYRCGSLLQPFFYRSFHLLAPPPHFFLVKKSELIE